MAQNWETWQIDILGSELEVIWVNGRIKENVYVWKENKCWNEWKMFE